MKRKAYTGYRPYAYLEAGEDYRAFDLAPDGERLAGEPGRPLLDAAGEARVERLLEESLVVSLHDHPIRLPAAMDEVHALRREGRDFLAYEGLSRSGLDVVFDGMANGEATITSKSAWKWDDIVYDLGMRLCDMRHQDFVYPAYTLAEVEAARTNGRLALVLTEEAATPIENELDRLDILYGLGVRVIGITYVESNTLGGGQWEASDGGLTHFGRAAVRRMNQLGMAIDVAHSGDRTSLETIEASRSPLFITHAGARSVWPTARMKPDDQLRALAQSSGVIGIEAAPHSTQAPTTPRHTLDAVMAHFEHCVNLMGIDHVAFGPDTLYGDHVAMHRAFAHLPPGRPVARAVPAFEPVPYVQGIENPTEAFPNIVRWLVGHGYADADIRKVLGENIVRVLRTAWQPTA
jgi:membrane dipeptidase